MRILHINSYYSTGSFYRGLYDALAPLLDGMRVYVPVPRGYEARFDFGTYADVVKTHDPWNAAIFQIKHGKILRDAEDRYKGGFDALHAHSLFSNGYVAMMLSERLGIPYIAAVRDADVNVFFRRMVHLRPLGKRILMAAKKVVFLSETYRQNALAPYLKPDELRSVMDKSAVLPNGIDDFWHTHRSDAKEAAHTPVRFLFVGQLVPRKNVKAAIEAVGRYREETGEAVLTVVGKAVSKREVDRVKDCPFAVYHPPTDKEGLLKYYRENDILLVPSKTETFGLVYAEAMSQGMPVLYTRGQGFDGQYEPGVVGFPVDAKDPRGMAEGAARVRRDMAATSSRCVEASRRYDWREIARAYYDLYREVIR